MTKTRLFKSTAILLFTIAVLYALEIKFYLTWTIWWYDIMLHFLAGGAVGMATLLFFQKSFKTGVLSLYQIIQIAIYSAFAVGILWEIFELYFDLTSLSDGVDYYMDTISDLFMDMLGGLIGSLYAIKTWSR